MMLPTPMTLTRTAPAFTQAILSQYTTSFCTEKQKCCCFKLPLQTSKKSVIYLKTLNNSKIEHKRKLSLSLLTGEIRHRPEFDGYCVCESLKLTPFLLCN